MVHGQVLSMNRYSLVFHCLRFPGPDIPELQEVSESVNLY